MKKAIENPNCLFAEPSSEEDADLEHTLEEELWNGFKVICAIVIYLGFLITVAIIILKTYGWLILIVDGVLFFTFVNCALWYLHKRG